MYFRLVSRFSWTLSLGHFVNEMYDAAKRWPSDKVKDNCETRLKVQCYSAPWHPLSNRLVTYLTSSFLALAWYQSFWSHVTIKLYCKTRNFDKWKLWWIWQIWLKSPNFNLSKYRHKPPSKISVHYKTKISAFTSISSMFLLSKFLESGFTIV